MLNDKIKKNLKKQHYILVGKHSSVKICEWTKKSLLDEGVCFKEKFYGIKSHRCCQMSPSTIYCQNKCIHCWRAIELTSGNKMNPKKINEPKEIITESILAQRKLISGFKGNIKTNKKKFLEAQEPMNFAISLVGEPTLYPKIGDFIVELRKLKKTTFLVTNGIQPNLLKRLNNKKQLPTQLYISLNCSNKKDFDKWHKSSVKDAWKKFNQTLKIFPKLKTRRVIRLTLAKGLNDNEKKIKDFAKLIKISKPDFIEIKSYMAIGFSRKRKEMGYEKMLSHYEIKSYSKRLLNKLKSGYKILDEHKPSRVVLIGKNKKKMKIKDREI
ncbi:MAG: 4-demethylwyosine synthase TYW1 [Candidatus Pacearchaeota archaeon]